MYGSTVNGRTAWRERNGKRGTTTVIIPSSFDGVGKGLRICDVGVIVYLQILCNTILLVVEGMGFTWVLG